MHSLPNQYSGSESTSSSPNSIVGVESYIGTSRSMYHNKMIFSFYKCVFEFEHVEIRPAADISEWLVMMQFPFVSSAPASLSGVSMDLGYSY